MAFSTPSVKIKLLENLLQACGRLKKGSTDRQINQQEEEDWFVGGKGWRVIRKKSGQKEEEKGKFDER